MNDLVFPVKNSVFNVLGHMDTLDGYNLSDLVSDAICENVGDRYPGWVVKIFAQHVEQILDGVVPDDLRQEAIDAVNNVGGWCYYSTL